MLERHDREDQGAKGVVEASKVQPGASRCEHEVQEEEQVAEVAEVEEVHLPALSEEVDPSD